MKSTREYIFVSRQMPLRIDYTCLVFLLVLSTKFSALRRNILQLPLYEM
jgi:hypothetical protein